MGSLVLRAGPGGRLEALSFGYSPAPPLPPGALLEALDGYFAGAADLCDVPVALPGGGFRRRVWEAARTIPRGEVRTYGWIARVAGSPGAARAAGRALGANPVLLAVPCHRVVASGGLGGFAVGTALKRRLLEMEGGAWGREPA